MRTEQRGAFVAAAPAEGQSPAALAPLETSPASWVPRTALAPMQDVTDLAFMRLVAEYGAPDAYFTEYFRVHAHSTLEKPIVASIERHGTGRPVFAQMIGEDLGDLARTARELERLPIAGVDLNMGCPAPKVYKKNVGGGLLRDPAKIDAIFGTLRQTVTGRFTVKMRVGFEDPRHYEEILALVAKHQVDLLTVHGRTVKQMYRGEVDYPRIGRAVGAVPCPVLANGNLWSAGRAAAVLAQTAAAGAMIGRAAIRNPWIFRQCRERLTGQPVFQPALGDARGYCERLWEVQRPAPEPARVARMKKFLNFVGQSVDPEGGFLREMRRAPDARALFAVCDAWMAAPDRAGLPFAQEPYVGVIARPNAEGPESDPEEQGCAL